MSIVILSPTAGASFTTAQKVTVSGTNGPVTSSSATKNAVAAEEFAPTATHTAAAAAAGGAAVGAWEQEFGPFTTPGTYTITVSGAQGKQASVTIAVTAA